MGSLQVAVVTEKAAVIHLSTYTPCFPNVVLPGFWKARFLEIHLVTVTMVPEKVHCSTAGFLDGFLDGFLP